MMVWQRTLQEKFLMHGIGLHTGKPITLEMLPATPDTGIVFVRADLPGHPEIRAGVAQLVDTTLATTLGVMHGGSLAKVSTVEHLLAATMSLGIDNARVLVHGPELPVLDGSALPWVVALNQVGTEVQRKRRTYLRVRREIGVEAGRKRAQLLPHPALKVTCSLDFDHPLIACGPYRYEAHPHTFAQDIAPARTFGFRAEVDALRERGLALGGSLENAIVIDAFSVMNPDGLRFADEFVRHKVLDALGDLALMGYPVLGRMVLHCSGHALNTQLVRETLQHPANYELTEAVHGDMDAEAVANPCSNPAITYLDVAKSLA